MPDFPHFRLCLAGLQLSAAKREQFLAAPETSAEFIQYYTFREANLSLIHQHRGAANRLGFAVQRCYLCFLGVMLSLNQLPALSLLAFVAARLKLSSPRWTVNGQRAQNRREQLPGLQTAFDFQTFALHHYRTDVPWLVEVARQTDKGVAFA